MLTGHAHSALSHRPSIKLRQTSRWKEGPRGRIPIPRVVQSSKVNPLCHCYGSPDLGVEGGPKVED